VVIDYGNIEDLFLLSIIDNVSYQEISIEGLQNNPFPLLRTLDINLYSDITEIKKINNITLKGYVVIFEDNFRIKVKNPYYKKVYKFYTQTLKKYALNKALYGNTDISFENKLPKEDIQWLERLITEILKLKESFKRLEHMLSLK
jgi:hypothetical protein